MDDAKSLRGFRKTVIPSRVHRLEQILRLLVKGRESKRLDAAPKDDAGNLDEVGPPTN